MRGTILNVRAFGLCNCMVKKQYQNFPKNYGTEEAPYTLQKEKIIHPYRKLHPWKSLQNFSQYLLDNVIYNKDGLVAINKPYGISGKKPILDEKNSFKMNIGVPHAVDYTLSDSLEFLAQQLGYAKLDIVKTQEKFMTGLTLLSADPTVERAINSSYTKAQGRNILNKTYWIVTTRVPNQINGKQRLCMKKASNQSKSEYKVVILDKWSKNEQKMRKIKILNLEFNVISNSTNNLSSLIEIKTSTIKWHALRIYCATRLYAPILGDNIYSRRIHRVAGQWLLVNPFVEVSGMPEINKELLELLHLTQAKQELIPCHIHARRILLPDLFGKETVTLEAPLIPPLDWTCKQLNFKAIPELEES